MKNQRATFNNKINHSTHTHTHSGDTPKSGLNGSEILSDLKSGMSDNLISNNHSMGSALLLFRLTGSAQFEVRQDLFISAEMITAGKYSIPTMEFDSTGASSDYEPQCTQIIT